MLRDTSAGWNSLRRLGEVRRFAIGADWSVHGAVETRTPADRYDWHGLRRGADASHPLILLQCTLDGWGEYVEGAGSPARVDAGKAFCAVIPTDHRYYHPATSPTWTFVWLMIRHPYIVSRFVETRRSLPAVIAMPQESALFLRMVRLLETSESASADLFAVEQALFDLMIEYERMAHAQLYPAEARERLLADVRAFVVAHLNRRVEVEELAEAVEMSRSHYAHHFKSLTGLPPAQFITQVRLDEAVHRLASSDRKLDAIAADTGFANANHFCKVFRRHFHMSPGEYRRQLG
jgi:AraC-like DNA-binding protein